MHYPLHQSITRTITFIWEKKTATTKDRPAKVQVQLEDRWTDIPRRKWGYHTGGVTMSEVKFWSSGIKILLKTHPVIAVFCSDDSSIWDGNIVDVRCFWKNNSGNLLGLCPKKRVSLVELLELRFFSLENTSLLHTWSRFRTWKISTGPTNERMLFFCVYRSSSRCPHGTGVGPETSQGLGEVLPVLKKVPNVLFYSTH